MLRTLIEKEIRDLVGSTKFVIIFGVCAFFIIAAFYTGAARHKLNVSQYNASQAEILRSLEGKTEWDEFENMRVFLSPRPLETLVSGVSNDVDRTAYISGRGYVPTRDSHYSEDPLFASFRFIDLDFVFSVILSLFAILFGYDAISGEKEQGTLRLTFANPVPRRTFILGKIIGPLISLTTAILIAVLLGILILMIMGIGLSGAEWIRLGLIIFTGLLFFGAFLTLSIFVSALTQRSANSFVILLVIWVLCIHIIPRTAVLLAGRAVDVPSVDEIAYQQSILATQLAEEFFDASANLSLPATASEDFDPAAHLNNFFDSLSNIRESKMNDFTARLMEDRHNRQKIQQALSFTLARISPLTSFTLATSQLAGTSLDLKDRFYLQATEFQKIYGDFIKEKTGFNPGAGIKIKASISGENDAEKPEPIEPGELPGFEYKDKNLAAVFASAIIDMGVLSLFNILFFAGSFIAFMRYDLR